MNERNLENNQKWIINTDGAIRPEKRISGLAAIVRNEHNQICYWWKQRAGALTCNEAEYGAAIFALEQMLHIRGFQNIAEVAIYSDSRVLVDQMSGRASAHAPTLQKARARLLALVVRFKKVSFHHISREQNRLADALAFEAVEGQPKESQTKSASPNLELWEQLESSWRTP